MLYAAQSFHRITFRLTRMVLSGPPWSRARRTVDGAGILLIRGSRVRVLRALRIVLNTGHSAYFGKKHRIWKDLEDN
jgi:hypothetical protein